MWKSQTLCDAIIRTGSIITKAHRVVLVAACPMLQSMENAAAGSHLEVRLTADIKQESINTFLQYLYEGFMTLTEENYKDIEKISRLLQVDNAIKCCADFIKCINLPSGNQYRYNYPDQMEFKHVRTTELQKVQDRNQKRSTDRPISPGSKRPRFQRQPSPMSDSRTHDMSGMKESYTVNDPWDRVPRLGSHSSTPSSVHVPSQQPGVIDIVEDSIELIQTEPPGKRPGEEERELRKVQSTVGVSVASQRDAPADVQIVSVPSASDVSSQKSASDSAPFIPSSPSSSDSSSLKERPPHYSNPIYPPKTEPEKSAKNQEQLSDVEVATQRPRPPELVAGSQSTHPYPISMTTSTRPLTQSLQQKPFAAGSAMQAESVSPGAVQRGPKPQTISRVENTEKAPPLDRPPRDMGSRVKDHNNRLSPDISIVKVENELGPEETGMLDMYVSDVGGGGSGQSHGQNDEDQSDYDVEEPPGDMHRDEMSNESGNMSMDQSGNWYMGNFRDIQVQEHADSPRPGIMEGSKAMHYGMVELAPNTSVYLYRKQYETALSKIKFNEKTQSRDGTPAARYLLSTFYDKSELINATIRNTEGDYNLYQGYTPLNRVIIYAIEDFCTKYSDTRLTTIHQTLGSKITSARARRSKVRKDFI
uniref:BTB domain-containing protein n=1 Tax=Magallana gigas TaxID=29159 RepID=A0A8W8MZT6_MAGGI